LKALISTRWCRGRKPGWLFFYVRWYQCQLFVLLSKLTSSRWKRHSKLTIERRKKFFAFHLSIGRGRRNSKINTCLFGNQHWTYENERFETSLLANFDFKTLSRHIFLSRMVIIGCRLGYVILTICTMMSLLGKFLLIPLSLIPLVGLLSSSLPWQNSTSTFLTLFLFPTSS